MTPVLRAWLRKAEGDAAAAELLYRSRKPGLEHSICFHCQQAVEKYLKARLQEADVRFPRTHDLYRLMETIGRVEPLWVAWAPRVGPLTLYAALARYRGEDPTRAQVTECIRTMRSVRRAIVDRYGAKSLRLK
jgi:HEPN domain-containing protein